VKTLKQECFVEELAFWVLVIKVAILVTGYEFLKFKFRTTLDKKCFRVKKHAPEYFLQTISKIFKNTSFLDKNGVITPNRRRDSKIGLDKVYLYYALFLF
jgi:hypothetical protein